MKSYDELKRLIDQRGVHEVFGAYGEGWGIEQNADELARFLVQMQELGVKSVLEIGTGWKAGLARFLHDDMGWTVTSVDIKDYGHQFGGITFEKSDGVEYPHFLELFDLVLIDGDHTYEAVLFDHDYYGKYASKVIAFHDIAGLRDCEGVRQYWWSIAREERPNPPSLKYGHYEIIADTPERGGIGYIVLSKVEGEAPLTATQLRNMPDVLDPDFPKPSDEPEPTPKKQPAKPKPTPRKRVAKKPASASQTTKAKKTTAPKK